MLIYFDWDWDMLVLIPTAIIGRFNDKEGAIFGLSLQWLSFAINFEIQVESSS